MSAKARYMACVHLTHHNLTRSPVTAQAEPAGPWQQWYGQIRSSLWRCLVGLSNSAVATRSDSTAALALPLLASEVGEPTAKS